MFVVLGGSASNTRCFPNAPKMLISGDFRFVPKLRISGDLRFGSKKKEEEEERRGRTEHPSAKPTIYKNSRSSAPVAAVMLSSK